MFDACASWLRSFGYSWYGADNSRDDKRHCLNSTLFTHRHKNHLHNHSLATTTLVIRHIRNRKACELWNVKVPSLRIEKFIEGKTFALNDGHIIVKYTRFHSRWQSEINSKLIWIAPFIYWRQIKRNENSCFIMSYYVFNLSHCNRLTYNLQKGHCKHVISAPFRKFGNWNNNICNGKMLEPLCVCIFVLSFSTSIANALHIIDNNN